MSSLQRLAVGMGFFDLNFRGRPRVIASALLQGSGAIAIVDPGPSSTLPVLRRHLADAGITVGDLTALLLTHIHLDHAGATGTLLRENPRLRVFVHERGAPHLIDPAKLLASASRLYADKMEELWGEVAPVPAEAIVRLTGGERIDTGGRVLDVAYTPGHASHHVSFYSADTGIAFVGDTAGVKVVPGGFVLPPTPPPDIDLALWRESLVAIERWSPRTLFLTHFGPSDAPGPHLTELRHHLDLVGQLAKESLAIEGDEAEREAWFIAQLRRELRQHVSEADADTYQSAGRFDLNWRGLARYWRKKN